MGRSFKTAVIGEAAKHIRTRWTVDIYHVHVPTESSHDYSYTQCVCV